MAGFMSVPVQMNDYLVPVGHSDHPAICALCHRLFSPDDEASDLEAVTVCGDCKFLLLEGHGTLVRDDYRIRFHGSRRRQHTNSGSIEDFFSEQFLQVINQARQNQATIFYHDNLTNDDDNASLVQHTSTRTTPNGSTRWRVFSDTESDAFDSFFGESESNFSFSAPRFFRDGSDAISCSAYEGGSVASADDNTFLENEDYSHPDGGSDNETVNDIDPMHAGVYHWNSSDIEEDGVDEYVGWEENGEEQNVVVSVETNVPSGGHHVLLPHLDNTTLRFQERSRGAFANIIANLEEQAGQSYVGNPGNYSHARGFEELLEHLAEAENARRGARPTAVSFLHNLPHLLISESTENLNGLACAICKDSLTVGTVVNQLPCFHLYHPSCILPWLSARNSCPLCRYELPTDDKDYEDRKQRNTTALNLQQTHQHDMDEDSSSDETNFSEALEQVNENVVAERSSVDNARRGWVFLAAAAPVVGVFLVLCLGNLVTERRLQSSQTDLSGLGRHPSRFLSRTHVSRDNGRNGTWWFPF